MSTSKTKSGPAVLKCSENLEHLFEWPPGKLWKERKDGNDKPFFDKISAIEKIGEGGFGEVFKGHRTYWREHTENSRINCDISKCLAIKVLKYKSAEASSKTSRNANSKQII